MLTEIVLPGLVGPEGLNVRQRPVPTPGKGQALVEMLATGVSFAEQQMRRGRYPSQPKFPFVLGYDLVGVVAAVGPQVDEALVGRRVAAVVKTGGWTTHALVDASHLVPVPDGIDAASAETVVVNGITAWQMLRKAKVHSGQTILVHGANGGVGSTLVQLARHAGIRVIGTASTRHHDALRAMGAEPIDYDDPELSERVRLIAPRGVDAVFDHLGGPSFERSFKLLAPAGRSWPMAWPPRRTTPATCSSLSSECTDDLRCGASLPTDVEPSFTTSGQESTFVRSDSGCAWPLT
jgi:NADPH:quinone reductase-like Zn-dependent oxidoreductase